MKGGFQPPFLFELARDEAMHELMNGEGNRKQQNPTGQVAEKLAWFSCRAQSRRRVLRILRQTVTKPYPIDLFRHPDVFGRCKGVAVVEGCEGNA